ncbi:peptidylprolyl isomerase [Campylobacter sp. MIT 12-5580]|uniref:peptidylprolyl isomerase n=1 Tax=Campylobacter sp. MIT 12-5580 TaxID=2040651 RepID=UPI0010F7642E|nr:peptidylprolyl isomerase [Campylobacter sp. MIT 12-5580]TKX28606.1 peptidylprolyl isomerase [Campylobacter sp. MIT 12-5580]
MITWMQRHKKWLVITMWISAIAFVGAGAVSWGSVDLNFNRNTSVAKVGDEKISFVEFNQRFNRIFAYFNQISNGTLTEAKAKEQGLDTLALQSLVEDKLLVSFAKTLGLSVSEDEILNLLISDENFWDSNKGFDKNIYYSILAQNDIKASQYEDMLASDILLRKLSVLFNLPVKEEELKMLASNYFMQDVLSIEPFKAKNVKIDINETKLEALWQGIKEDFKTEKRYFISNYFIPLEKHEFSEAELQAYYDKNKQNYTDFSGKILSFQEAKEELKKDLGLDKLKDEANQKYLALNKKELDFQKELILSQTDIYYPLELLEKTNAGGVLKPFKFEDGYMIVRLNAYEGVRTKSFEEAREQVLPIYEEQERKAELEKQAKEALNNFKGKNIGSVSRDSLRNPERVDEEVMNDAEFSLFLMNVFNSDQNKSFVLLDDKAILYEIKAQNLLNNSKLNEYKTTLEQEAKNAKASELRQELLTELRKRYAVEIYYKGNIN